MRQRAGATRISGMLGLFVLFIIAFFSSASAQVPTVDSRNVNLRGVETHAVLRKYHSLLEWEQRKAFLRDQILVSAGLSPMPTKTPLHAQVFGRIEGETYTIEKVLLETLPGFYLGGNLYRPRDNVAKHPGVLNPHGHWVYGRLENQPLSSGPSLGISLARQGYVVFAYDMVGYTDTIQIPHHFDSPARELWSFTPLGLQLWDSIRSLDFLSSLDDVDASKIGVTGASGGGTQTFLLTAIDDRVQFASPVNMVSAIMQGGDECENAPGLRIGTNNVEIAAMFAPKPMLLVSATEDWTHNVPQEEYPAIRSIYALYGETDDVEAVQIAAPHNFNEQSREAVYRFFAKFNPGTVVDATLKEDNIDVPKLQDMMVLSNKSLPSGAADLEGIFHEWQEMGRSSLNDVHDSDRLRRLLIQTMGVTIPDKVLSERAGQNLFLSSLAVNDRLPGVWIPGHGRAALVVDSDGSKSALRGATVAKLRREGRAILVLDVFQTGSSIAVRDESDPMFLTYNIGRDAARVQDIVTATTYLGQDKGIVDIFATGDAGLWATFASAVVPWHVSLHLVNTPDLRSDDDYLKHFNVPGIERAGGLTVASRLAAH